MNRHKTVAAVTAAFGQIVDAAATGAVANAVTVFERPDTSVLEPKVYIYMYQVTPNAAARNQELPVRSGTGTGRQRPYTALDLHYLLTFVGDDKKLEPQKMLGSVVGDIHARPLLTPDDIRAAQTSGTEPPLIGDDDEVPITTVRFTPMGLNLDELSKVWSVFFQTPYALSVAYRASVVLVEADIPIRPPLPAQRAKGDGGILSNPIIAQIAAAEGLYQPITSSSTLVITGKRLAGEHTLVRFADGDVEPAEASPGRVSLPVPVEAHRAGLHSARIVHRPWDADPGDTSDEVESNMGSFVVHPEVAGTNLVDTTLDVEVAPPVLQEQRAELLLDQLDVEEPKTYRLRRLDFAGSSATTLQFDVSAVDSGRYAVRVRIDGAASMIEIDQDTIVHTVQL